MAVVMLVLGFYFISKDRANNQEGRYETPCQWLVLPIFFACLMGCSTIQTRNLLQIVCLG